MESRPATNIEDRIAVGGRGMPIVVCVGCDGAVSFVKGLRQDLASDFGCLAPGDCLGMVERGKGLSGVYFTLRIVRLSRAGLPEYPQSTEYFR